MSDNDEHNDAAYDEAVRLIAEAKSTGAQELSFDNITTRALDELPPEIATLDKLRGLILNNTLISDLRPLTAMVGMGALFLENTRVTDLSPLAGMIGLTSLRLTNTRVTDLSPLSGMATLLELYLSNTQVADLAPIAEVPRMYELRLDGTLVTDLRPIAKMRGPTTLVLDNTNITDLTPIAGKLDVEGLFLNKTLITDLSSIAGMTGIIRLYLNDTQITDLTPIASMKGMRELRINNTVVGDLGPITDLTGMQTLHLENTKITDLTTVVGMRDLYVLSINKTPVLDLRFVMMMEKWRAKLGKGAINQGGLLFKDTSATRADPRLAEIAEIGDDSDRMAALFEYLKDWVPPGEAVAPEPDDLLPVLLVDGKLEIARSLPSVAESDDRLKRALHDRLRLKAEELARVAGNTQGRLAARARSLAGRLDGPFDALDMINIHMDVEDLSTSLRTNADRVGEDRYSPDILDALSDVTSIGPGLTLDNADVEKLEDRKRRFAATPPGPEIMAAHNEFSKAVAANVAAVGDNLRALEARIAERDGEASSGALQVSTHRDMFIRIGRYALVGAGTLVMGAAGNGLWELVKDNWGVIVPLVNGYGTGFAQWFIATMAQVSELSGSVAHIEVKPISRRREPK